MYIFLDESGDLGFDFKKSKTSKFFVMTLLVCNSQSTIKIIKNAVQKTLKKINHKRKKDFVNELKGANTPLKIKQYFLDKIISSDWSLRAVVIDKKKFHTLKYINRPNHLYNHIAMHLFSEIMIDNPQSTVVITVDKCKTEKETQEFNRYVAESFFPKMSSTNNLIIKHQNSCHDKLLQAVDVFCNGIFAKYEANDCDWLKCFNNKMYADEWF